MKKIQSPKQIEKFIKKTFLLYNLSYGAFFSEYDDEEGKNFELPMFLNGKLVMPIVERAAMCLGLSTENLLSMDESAVKRRYHQYPYFKKIKEFYHIYHESYFKESVDEFLRKSIFSDADCITRTTHFDYNNVKKRLLACIDTYSTDFPSLKHEEKTISYLEIRTETVFQYEHFELLIVAYLDMIQHFKTLFYKAWTTELSSNEVLEYNFLVSCLGIRDVAYTADEPLYYDLLKSFIPIYKSENCHDIFSYIKVSKDSVPPLWKCADFADYPDSAKRFAEIYPDVKSELRRTAMDAKNFRCAYLWSDEKKPDYSPEHELYLLDALHSFGDKDACGAYHYLYVPKTEGELGEVSGKIEKLSILSGPETLGGLPTPRRETNAAFSESIKRMQARIAAAPKMKWGVNLYE